MTTSIKAAVLNASRSTAVKFTLLACASFWLTAAAIVSSI